MPLRNGRDANGPYYMWGDVKGHKYYYPAGNEVARKAAKQKAIKQAVAAAYSMADKCTTTHPPPDYCSYERRIKRPGSTLKKKEAAKPKKKK